MKLVKSAIIGTIVSACIVATSNAFSVANLSARRHSLTAVASSSTATATSDTEAAVADLKKTLTREYASLFDPMYKEYYSEDVSFIDPMISLSGADAYKANVDMLGSRSLFGKFLFRDGGIVLHKIEGGDVSPEDGSISDITTRWTLRVTMKVLPWKPTARFTGISVYSLKPQGPKGIQVTQQRDFWDSVNLIDGDYQSKSPVDAIADLVQQLAPENGNAASAGPEVPYQILRRAKDYEVRKYPSYTLVKIPYERRDEGFDQLATITKGKSPLAPAIMQVPNDDNSQKFMSWPLVYAAPGSDVPPSIDIEAGGGGECITVPSQVVAVGSFSDASVAPIVRRTDRQLREALKRDGLGAMEETSEYVKFAQYDAIYTLGKRRGEVWIPLEDGKHPW